MKLNHADVSPDENLADTLIVLDGERPMSWNAFYSGVHWNVRKSEAERVHWLVREKLDADSGVYTVPVTLTVTAYFAHHPMDASNICAKLYEDALKGFVIWDDSPAYVDSVTTRSRIDKQRPRVEILVSPVGSLPY